MITHVDLTKLMFDTRKSNPTAIVAEARKGHQIVMFNQNFEFYITYICLN